MTLRSSQAQMKQTLDTYLARFFAEKQTSLGRKHRKALHLVEEVKRFTLGGGKRLRPYFLWLGYAAYKNISENSQIPAQVLKTCAALELFQTFALIHDDIIDADDLRRGNPSSYKQFELMALEKSILSSGAARFGQSMAILAGSLALAWSDELMLKTDSLHLQQMYDEMKEQMIVGQSLDILNTVGIQTIDKAMINEIKTAWYSVIWPLCLGHTLSGDMSHSDLVFKEYGLAVGLLFQMRDDVLDQELTLTELKRQAKPLREKAQGIVKKSDINPWVREKLLAMVSFVVTRKS